MNKIVATVIGSLLFLHCFSQREVNFGDNWLFTKDSTLEESKWRQLDLPHDWSIENLPNQNQESVIGPFDKNSVAQGATGFTVGGVGWYRKKFITEKSFRNRIVTLYFDGVYMNSDIWLNGHLLGHHAYGYTPFHYDLTPYLNSSGIENLLVVRAENKGKNSRWYAGSGIYRDVWLTVTGMTPIDIQVITKEVIANRATIEILLNIESKGIKTIHTIISPQQKIIARGETTSFEINAPELWSIENPKLYTVITEIQLAGKEVDRIETKFGIRTISFSAENGFQLNGRKVLLKGGCIHHDHGPLGAAVYYRAEERKVELLKQNGFNAIRTSHNPPSRELLDACDKIGMLVIDEAFDMWEKPKNPQDYHLYFKDSWQQDIDALILRDRNHPSVIMWSIGNEIKERVDTSGLRIAKQLVNHIHQLDPGRPVTEAICTFWDNPGYEWKQTVPVFNLLNVGSYNYLYTQYEKDHEEFPERVMIGTESFAKYALENWNMVEQHPYVIGDFVWTAFDYIGEASIGNSKYEETEKRNMALGWPFYNGYCGDLDLIGNKKPQSYYRDVVWSNRPVAMAVHAPIPDGLGENISYWGWPDETQSWTWPEAAGEKLQVRVFSRAPIVRLMLNNKLIGEKSVATNSIITEFEVPYEPGTLKAINIIGDTKTDSVEFKTTGAPSKIRLIADRWIINRNRDLSYVMVEVVDNNNQVVPNAILPIDFSVDGEGTIAAVGNGSPDDVASFQAHTRRTWRGKCLVILKSNGKKGNIILRATGNNLSPSKIKVSVN